MRRSIPFCAFIFLFASAVAFAADDDGIMGNWEGKFTSDTVKDCSISAEVVALGPGTSGMGWRLVLAVGGGGKQDSRFSVDVSGMPKTHITGSAKTDLGAAWGGKQPVSITIDAGTLKGAIGKGKKASTFELSRVMLKSKTLGAAPPAGAVALMDGKNLDAWQVYPATWNIVDGGAAEVGNLNLLSKQSFGDCRIHVEFRTPFMPSERGQARGNSGVYVQGRYEIQVLDSFGLDPADNLCGGIYKQAVPKARACYPPLSWQTYDITYYAPKFDASGKKTKNAVITVVHNGITIHDNLELAHPTPGGIADNEVPQAPIMLQHHHDPVQYRNIWVQPL